MSPPLILAERERPVWGFGEVFIVAALFIPALAIGGSVIAWFHGNPESGLNLLLAQAIAYAILFGALRLLAARYRQPLFRSLGWTPQRFGIVPLAVLGMVLSAAVVLLGGVLRLPETQTPFEKLLSDPASRIAIALFGVTLAPVIEELLFRGLLQPVLVNAIGVLPGILVTSALFGAMHLAQNGFIWQTGVLITFVGFVLGVIRRVSGSTRASAITHIAYNFVPFLYVLFSGNNS